MSIKKDFEKGPEVRENSGALGEAGCSQNKRRSAETGHKGLLVDAKGIVVPDAKGSVLEEGKVRGTEL